MAGFLPSRHSRMPWTRGLFLTTHPWDLSYTSKVSWHLQTRHAAQWRLAPSLCLLISQIRHDMRLNFHTFGLLRVGESFRWSNAVFVKESRDLACMLRDRNGDQPDEPTAIFFEQSEGIELLARRTGDETLRR